jgi:hypothetical protein
MPPYRLNPNIFIAGDLIALPFHSLDHGLFRFSSQSLLLEPFQRAALVRPGSGICRRRDTPKAGRARSDQAYLVVRRGS